MSILDGEEYGDQSRAANALSKEFGANRKLHHVAMSIVNPILEASSASAQKRQAINDKCDALVIQQLRQVVERCAAIADSNSCGWDCDCGHNHAEDAAAEIRSEFQLEAPNMNAIGDDRKTTYRQLLIRHGDEWHEWRLFPNLPPQYCGTAPIFVVNDDPESKVMWYLNEVRP
jgi:hypothetical protein